MILQSKLSRKYPEADPAEWLTGETKGEDPVFLRRLAAYSKYCYEKGLTKIKRMKINTGIRSDAFQLELYNEAQAYKKPPHVLGKHGVKNAAYPGESYHGEHVCLAVDVDKSHPFYEASNAELAPFGLCKPLLSIGEVWHGQPIETLKLGADASVPAAKALYPIDLAPQLKTRFGIGDQWIENIANYEYGVEFAAGLLAGKKTFTPQTIAYFSKFPFWVEFKSKTGLAT